MIPIQSLVSILMTGIGSLIALFIFYWKSALILLGISVIPMLLNLIMVLPNRYVSAQMRQVSAQTTENIANIVSSRMILRIHGIYAFVFTFIDRNIGAFKELIRKQGRLRGVQNVFSQAGTLLVYVAVVFIGIVGWQKIPSLIATIQLASGPMNLFSRLSGILVELQNSLSGADRVLELMDVYYPTPAMRQALDRTADPYMVKNLSFAYQSGQSVLYNISFTIREGTITGIYGASGSGKSTLLKLLSGLYEFSGTIQTFGIDLRIIPSGQLNDIVCYIQQSPYLFFGTVSYNISLGNKAMSDEEIRSFALLADADSFINELPGGYNYIIVKGGANLSVGQKQRIVLARAFARQPMIMLLDEPTAALDNENAYRVIEKLKNIKGITKIVTTHNTTLKPMFDQVIAI